MITGYLAEAVAAEWLMAAAVLLQLYSSFAYYFSPLMRAKENRVENLTKDPEKI